MSLGVAKVVNVTPRYARLQADANGSGLGQIIGWQNIELISDRPLETMLQKILTAIRRVSRSHSNCFNHGRVQQSFLGGTY